MAAQKHLLISGATGNLGKAVSKRLLQEGYALHSNYRENAPAETNPENAFWYQADLTDPARSAGFADSAIQKAGTIHAGIFLAGGFAMGTIEQANALEIEKMLSINFMTALNLVQPLKKYFEAQGSGQFIFIGARPALVPSQAAGSFAYALSKSLLFQLAEVINAEKKGITASVIVPSIIDTPDNREAMPDAAFDKWILPEDIAESIAFLLSDTGQKMKEPILKLYHNA